MVKLEILGDKKTLYPDMIETLKTTKVLVKKDLKFWFIAQTILCMQKN